MRSFLSLAAITPLVPIVFGQLTINTPPSVVQCQPALLTWSGGIAPYYVTILPGGQPSAVPLETFPQTDATALTWTVDIVADNSISLQIRDSTGAVAFTDQVKILDSSDSSCVDRSITVPSGPPVAAGPTVAAGGADAAGAAGATVVGAPTTTESMASGPTTTETRATTSSSATFSSPASNASNAAVRGAISYGAVGIAGLWGLVAAL